MPDVFVPLVVALLGLVFGSFANVVIWRFPRSESLSHPGSRCPSCGGSISWLDNIPVVSWLALKAKCRECGAPIPVRYPAVELTSGVLWLLAWALWGLSLRTAFGIAFFYLLLILSAIDLDTYRLPNKLVAILGVIGLVGVGLSTVTPNQVAPLLQSGSALSHPVAFAGLGMLLGAGIPLAIAALYSVIRGVSGLGMGDIKLLAVMGLFLGPYVLLALMLGSVVGAVASVVIGTGSGARRKIPFGPFLATGAVITAAVGMPLWEWYSSML